FLPAQSRAEPGTVTGTVIDKATGKPAEYVALALKNRSDGAVVRKVASDDRGAFAFEDISFGQYTIAYSYVGSDGDETPPFAVNTAHRSVDLGRLVLSSAALKMEKVEVSERKDAFYNSIDRKV